MDDNLPEVHVTVVESPAPESTPETQTQQVAETLGAAAAVVDMAQQLAETAAPAGDAAALNELLQATRETNALLRDLVGEIRQTREAAEITAAATVADVAADVAAAEKETETVAEVGEVIKEAIEETAPIEADEKPRERRRRWI